MKQDISTYSDNELSLLVFNDEYLYKRRHLKCFEDVLSTFFIFSTAQYVQLKEDLEEDLKEINNET